MGIGPEEFDPEQPVTPENNPSPWKNNPDRARADGAKGGLAKAARGPVEKSLDKLRKKQMKLYEEKLEKRVVRMNKLLDKFEEELLSPVVRTITNPDGTTETRTLPMTEGKLELLLKYHKQMHEIVVGKPKQHTEISGNIPITLIIQEENEPIDITPEVIKDELPDNLKIIEESGNEEEGR